MAMQKKPGKSVSNSSSREISAFLGKARQLQTRASANRLIFALDATASRQPTWDRACHLQAQMFESTRDISGLAIQLCYYRGLGEFTALPWSNDSAALRQHMLEVNCLGGYSQIERLLQHSLTQHRQAAVRALVFIGDAVEEDHRGLYRLAGELGLRRLPAFMFQEGFDAGTAQIFAEIARLSGGVHCQFDDNSKQQLRDLLTAVAVYAAGGVEAMKKIESRSALLRHIIKKLPDR